MEHQHASSTHKPSKNHIGKGKAAESAAVSAVIATRSVPQLSIEKDALWLQHTVGNARATQSLTKRRLLPAGESIVPEQPIREIEQIDPQQVAPPKEAQISEPGKQVVPASKNNDELEPGNESSASNASDATKLGLPADVDTSASEVSPDVVHELSASAEEVDMDIEDWGAADGVQIDSEQNVLSQQEASTGEPSEHVASVSDSNIAEGKRAVPTAGESPRTGTSASNLNTWKASISARTGEIQDPQLEGPAAAPGRLAQYAQSIEQQRQSEGPDYLQDVRNRMPPAPQEPRRENMLDTRPADAAIASVESVGAARLPDQTFPAMHPLPHYAGTPAGGSVRPPTVMPPAPTVDATPITAQVGPDIAADVKADGVKAKMAAVAPPTAGAGTGQVINLQDKGAAPLALLSPAQAIDIGDLVARVLQDVGRYAKEIVDAALAQLDPTKKVEALTQLAVPLLARQQDELATELNGVATAAGVSAEQLAVKVERQKTDAATKTENTKSDLDTKSTQAKADVQTRGTEETTAISGAGKAAAEEINRKKQAAEGQPDAAAIDAKCGDYIEKINATVDGSLARYRVSVERRAADLDHVGAEQKSAYNQRSRAEAERIKAMFPGDPEKGNIESRPVLDWGEQQALEVDGTVARLQREAATASAQLHEPLNDAAQAARNQIRDWAASKKGTQRGWWDRLLDLFADWTAEARDISRAWETQRNAETRDAVARDFDMLARVRDVMAAGNQEAFRAELLRLSKEQQVVVMAFIASGGKDSIGAVAIGLVERIKSHRVPELAKALEAQAIAKLGWEDLNRLGAAQSPGFDAGLIIRDVRGSVKGLGTDEKRLFKAIQGRTPIQIAALRRAYAATYPGRDMDNDIKGDLDGSEMERAEAYLSGDKTAGAIATLHDAMSGAGTDEELIMQTLRGKTPAERDAITAAYKEKYGVELKTDLEDEMSDNDLDQANALVAGDTTKADAIAIHEATSGIGTDEKGINAVYSRIRDEVEADAKSKGMTTAEVNAEIQRRTGALKRAYGAKYAGGDPNQMEADFRDDLSGGELNLVLAEQVNDQTAMDAAKIQIEHESLYTDDDKVNAVLIAQHDRAKKEIMRDLEVDFTKRSAHMTPEERKKAREQMEEQAKGMIAERAKQNMAALKERYDADNPEFGFQAVMDIELQGYSHDEALERIKAGGKLDDAHELKYSIFGSGTNEDRIKETLKGKSKAEIDKIKADYKALTGGNELADDINGDMAGRDLADTMFMLDGTSTPAEKMAYLLKRKEWELNQGTGLLGEASENEEEDVLERTTEQAQSAYDKYQELKKQFGENDPLTKAAREEFEHWSGYSDKDIEEHRAALDTITDTIATGVAIVAGVAVTILTAGTAAPAVVAGVGTVAAALGTTTTVVAAAAGAIVATAASIATKELMKGGAYDIEAIAVDMAQGTVEAMVAVATAGTGEAALKALLKSPAFAALAEAAESGTLGRLAIKGAEGGIEGAVQGLPSGMAGAILNENTWKSDNPFAVIVEAGGHGSLQGAGMGAAMGASMEAFGPKSHGGGPIDEGAGPSGEGAAPVSEPGNAPVDSTGHIDEGAHGTSTDEGGRGASADSSVHATEREPQAPRSGDESSVADLNEAHAPDTESTIKDAPVLEADVRSRIENIRKKYRDEAVDPSGLRKVLKEIGDIAKRDPAAAAEHLDGFEKQAPAREIEQAFTDAGKWATTEEKALHFEPGEVPIDALTVIGQGHRRLGKTSASTELRASMAAEGDPCPPGHDTHHIVAHADPRAAVAREILRDAGINPRNAPENGIHLPPTSMDPSIISDAASRHQTIHTDAYYKELTLRLIAAKRKNIVLQTLAQIKAEISYGRFMDRSELGGTKGESFATWLLAQSTDLEWMTPDEIIEVVEGATRGKKTTD